VPASATAYDTFAAAASELPSVGGNFLKHDGNRGGWMLEGVPILQDDRWLTEKVRYGYKYLAANQPVEDYPQAPGQPFVQRHQLGVHDNQALWPVVDGERKDPVKAYIAIDLLRIRDGSYCSYDALNPTGRRALTEFIRKIAWQRGSRGPAAKPVLTLDSRSMNSKYRVIWVPVFEIVSWVIPDGQGGMRLETDADQPSVQEKLDDEIVF
jgi:hypothetical protein